MATVLTTFVTANNQIAQTPFRSATPKRCKLRTVNLSAELQELYEVEQLEIVFPFGPKDLQHASQAAVMDQIARPGKKPLLEKRNEPLRTVTFNAVISGTAGPSGGKAEFLTGTTPVDAALETIERIAQSGATCKFTYGTVQLGYFCCLTKFDFTVKYRDSDGHPVRVDAQFQLTEKPAFSQELTNLPVIPNDPPEQPPPKGLSPEEKYWAQVMSNFGSTNSVSYFNTLRDSKASGTSVDPVVHERFKNSYDGIVLEMQLGIG